MRRGSIFANIDWITVFLWILMMFLGWLNIFSAVYSENHPNILDFNQRYGKQFIWIMAAFIIGIIIMITDHKFFEFFAYVIYLAAILLLLGVLVAGKEINGARSWLMIGGFQIQPSEFAKPAVALALAKYLSGFNLKINNTRTYLISAILIFSPAILILLQPDAGSTMIFMAFILPIYREGFSIVLLLVLVSFVVLFLMFLLLPKFLILAIIIGIAIIIWGFVRKSFMSFIKAFAVMGMSFLLVFGIFFLLDKEVTELRLILYSMIPAALVYLISLLRSRLKSGLIIISAAVLATAYIFMVDFAFHNVLDDYQQRRVNILLGIESDPQGAGYNLNQSKIAIGSGGLTGKGYLHGTQTKLDFVPEQSTDFIFCTVGEEWGFLGSVVVIALFSLLLIRLIQLSERQRSKFARIYGYGVVSVFFFHYFINIAMTIGLFPVIGIPLPFFSYGGSSLWAFTILLFIFIRLDASRMEHIN